MPACIIKAADANKRKLPSWRWTRRIMNTVVHNNSEKNPHFSYPCTAASRALLTTIIGRLPTSFTEARCWWWRRQGWFTNKNASINASSTSSRNALLLLLSTKTTTLEFVEAFCTSSSRTCVILWTLLHNFDQQICIFSHIQYFYLVNHCVSFVFVSLKKQWSAIFELQLLTNGGWFLFFSMYLTKMSDGMVVDCYDVVASLFFFCQRGLPWLKPGWSWAFFDKARSAHNLQRNHFFNICYCTFVHLSKIALTYTPPVSCWRRFYCIVGDAISGSVCRLQRGFAFMTYILSCFLAIKWSACIERQCRHIHIVFGTDLSEQHKKVASNYVETAKRVSV